MRAAVSIVITISTLTFLSSQSAPFQVPESPGVLAIGDFDADGCDDVIVFGAITKSRTYFGRKLAPHLVRGPDWPFDQLWKLMDVPVFAGGYLYVPVTTLVATMCEVRVYRLVNGAWTHKKTMRIAARSPGSAINSLKLHAFYRDVDGDKRLDVIAAWGDAPYARGRGVKVAYLTPTGSRPVANLPPLRGQSANAVVVDIHAARKLITTKTPEYIVTLSAQKRNALGGFGFATVVEGPRAGAGLWAQNGPPLAYSKYLHLDSPVSYGDFNLLPTVKTPLIQVTTGESLLFLPWLTAPYVTNQGQILPTRTQSTFLDQCVADYDGDGRDEVVLVRSSRTHHLGFLHVGDPSSNRAYVQFFSLASAGLTPSVFHGAAGDFDGDGDKDLLITYYHGGLPFNGFFGLFVADRTVGKGKPSLRRLY
jgi:FG-GAP-like repeat